MSDSNSTRQPTRSNTGQADTVVEPVVKAKRQKPATKPEKPRPDFPLTYHPAGYWCKKIRGKIHYFGWWDDPAGAEADYNRQREALHEGRKPRDEEEGDGLTVKRLTSLFLDAQDARTENQELSPLSLREYESAVMEVRSEFGDGRRVDDLRPDDFAALRARFAKKWGLHKLARTVQSVRTIFKWTFDSGLIHAVRFGPGFKKPGKKVMRAHRNKQPPKFFAAKEIHKLLKKAPAQLRAMILLGINSGFGNSDCGNLPEQAIDLKNGWVNFPRPKTSVPRRCPLWPETVKALKKALADRPAPKREEDAALVFVTRYGESWFKPTPDGPISREFGKLLRALGLDKCKGRGFYSLRHTFRTVADEIKDPPAIDYIMGHESEHVSTHYREHMDDARLLAITDHVHAWLHAKPSKKSKLGQRPVVLPMERTA
jgi:integrase